MKSLKATLLAAGILALQGCGDIRDTNRGDLFWDGVVNGQRVVYYNNGGILFGSNNTNSDIMEFYNKKGELRELMRDFNGDEVIGDVAVDRYVLYDEEGKAIIYAKYFVDDQTEGIRYSGNDNISKAALEASKRKLGEATEKYQKTKRAIEEKLKDKFGRK